MRHPSPYVSVARRALMLAALSAIPSIASAQAGLPEARSLVDKYIAAIGGREKILGYNSATTKGTFEVPAQGVTGDYELNTSRPNLMAMRINIPGLGEITSGFNGTVAWSNNPMQGPHVMSGPELESVKDQADPETVFRPASKLNSMKTVEKTQMGGQECYKVEVAWKTGRTSFDCYSTATGLLIGASAKQETQMGAVDVMTTFADYKDFDGVKRPTRVTQEAMGIQQVMTLKSVEYNKVDAKAFELPKEIKALVEKKP
jgi:hypothetical protein